MSELDKLEQYLKEHKINYKRFDQELDKYGFDIHKVVISDDKDEYLWDAICHRGSYGYEKGLLEIYGTLVNEEKDGDSVVGWLTAEDVIERIEQQT